MRMLRVETSEWGVKESKPIESDEDGLKLSRDLGYLPDKAAASALAEADQIARMLNSLRSRVEESMNL